MHENPDLPNPDPVMDALEREFEAPFTEYLRGVNATLNAAWNDMAAKADADDRLAAGSRARRIFESLAKRSTPRRLAAAITEQWYSEARLDDRTQTAAVRAYLTGRIQAGERAPLDRAHNLRTIADQVTAADPGARRALEYSRERAAELVQGLHETTRKAIALEVIDHQLQPARDPKRLEQRLGDAFATLTRDNRRVAITETSINTSNGFIAGIPVGAEAEWSAARDACPNCRKYHGKRFKVVAEPGDHHAEIWVGKNNFGRSFHPRKIDGSLRTSDELAGPVIPAHPHCRCRWLRVTAKIIGTDPRMLEMLDRLLRLPA